MHAIGMKVISFGAYPFSIGKQGFNAEVGVIYFKARPILRTSPLSAQAPVSKIWQGAEVRQIDLFDDWGDQLGIWTEQPVVFN